MAFFNRAKGLTGLNPLAYMGQEGAEGGNTTVPLVCYPDDPGPTDWQNFNLMTLWLNTTNNNLWYLASLAGNQALWLLMGSGSGILLGLTGNTGGEVFPLAGNINVVGDGIGITIAGNPGTHTLTASLVGGGSAAQSFVTDNGIATPIAGVIDLFATPNAGHSVSFNAATNVINLKTSDANLNTNIGGSSGYNIIGSNNTSLGFLSMASATTAINNVFIGLQAGVNLTTSTNCVGVGINSLSNLLTGSNNIGLGSNSGNNYIGAESSNICIGNLGTAGESNTIHIGTLGSGAAQQTSTFLDGGSVIIPGPTTGSSLQVFGHDSAVSNSYVLLDSNDNIGVNFLLGKTRLGSAVQTGDGLGTIFFAGADGVSGITPGASISSTVTGAVITGNRIGSNLVFGTHPDAVQSGTTPRMTISSAGNVTIAAPDSGVALKSIATFGQVVAASGIPVVVDAAGLFGTVVSSAKFKENIVDMLSHSDLIMKLRPVVFNYIEDKFKNTAVGLIAEEVAEVMPDLAVKNAEGEMTTVKYLDLIPMMLNEIQKLNKRLEALEAK